MGAISERERLIRNVVRLRTAQSVPERASEEVGSVRSDLERVVGSTVPRAMAARLLGVSQTALDRWVAHGDVPVVVSPAGRREVPLHALLELVELVERRRTAAGRDALAAVLRERRAQAAHLDVADVLPDRLTRRAGGGHRGAELRSLAYHRAVARRLDDRLVRDARERLTRWRQDGKIDPRYAEEWQALLARPLAQIARRIGENSERASALRQSTPFAGALSEPERRRVLLAVDAAQRGVGGTRP